MARTISPASACTWAAIWASSNSLLTGSAGNALSWLRGSGDAGILADHYRCHS